MTSPISSLVAVDGNQRFIWNPESANLEVTEGDSKHILLLTSRPYFVVREILLSPLKNLLALCGDNGVSIVELPKKWGRKLKSDEDGQIYCKTYNINERLFTCEVRLRTLHIAWYPLGTELKQLLCILTNDQRLRFHDAVKDEELQSIKLRPQEQYDSDDEDNDCTDGRLGLSMLNMAESAVCFDFGPPLVLQEPDILRPIYILMATGDILLVYSNFQNPTYNQHIIGPLTMLPQAEDSNYCSDACSLIVLESSPPLLAIATPTGSIYHCFAFLEKDRILSRQTLYVYEAVEISKDLIENPNNSYNPHPMKLFKDPTSEVRYFCVHQNGVHAVVLPILESLHADYDAIEEKESFSEFVICTRTTTPTDTHEQELDTSTPLGLGVEVCKTNINLIVLMLNNSLTIQRISPATALINRKRFPRHSLDTSRDSVDKEILNTSQIATRANFEEQIQQILKRKTTVPMLKLSEDAEQKENIPELINKTINTFRTEYIRKFNLASEAIKKKLTILEKDMQNQNIEYNKISKEKDEVYVSIIGLSTKADSACKKQKELLSRIDHVLSAVTYGPDSSEAETKLRREVKGLNEKLRFYRDQLDTIINKHKYHMNQKDPNYNSTCDLILSTNQLNVIKETLSRHGAGIADLKRLVKSKQ